MDFLKNILIANGYPSTFLDACLNKFLSSKFQPTVEKQKLDSKKKTVFLSLPFCGETSQKVKRQLLRMFHTVVPCLALRIVFKPVNKLSGLSKLKDKVDILSRSNVVYRVNCSECNEFYIGKTKRRLKQRMKEHASSETSALFKHGQISGHHLNYSEPDILATDSINYRLLIKETLKINECSAYKSLNGNVGSFELKLW